MPSHELLAEGRFRPDIKNELTFLQQPHGHSQLYLSAATLQGFNVTVSSSLGCCLVG